METCPSPTQAVGQGKGSQEQARAPTTWSLRCHHSSRGHGQTAWLPPAPGTTAPAGMELYLPSSQEAIPAQSRPEAGPALAGSHALHRPEKG